jgi:hypothetical protein
MHVEDAATFIIDYLQKPRGNDDYSSYGYDIWLPKVIVAYIREVERSTEHLQALHNGRRRMELSPFFYEAAWDLCRWASSGRVSRGAAPTSRMGQAPMGIASRGLGEAGSSRAHPLFSWAILTGSAKCLQSSLRNSARAFCSEQRKL